MATVHNHIDSSSVTGGPWLTTYSRALSSIYGTDEDHCWDYLLSSTIVDSRANTPANTSSSSPSPPTNANTNSLYYNNNSQDMASTLAPLSPASLSHALCKFGFDCIDYFTATQLDNDDDDDTPTQKKPPTPAPSPAAASYSPIYTSPMLDELTDSDWRTGLAAAVCGKRTAALERKRVLSRTMSQEEILSPKNGVDISPLAPLTAANIASVTTAAESNSNSTNDDDGAGSANPTDRRRKRDPWFEALDRLARWDEVAYR
ncbi:hypothetical protein BG015_010934 [Linnemannia schmuckeri]|uniref:Uncharacterized protein n=1 Tax=Linnemannia schmuckeri TaxID=64567 RepID=A0A9P5S8K6_9FUNG|nr:hypothetical protein BG015_010934 [Linnemannia schmuckeri]